MTSEAPVHPRSRPQAGRAGATLKILLGSRGGRLRRREEEELTTM
jgi:hypothetical protein